jgi:superfamily II DNA or RNA helicase
MKGSKMASTDYKTFTLRPWQSTCIDLIKNSYVLGKRDFLVEACPGAGKTPLTLELLHAFKQLCGNINVLIVVPTLQVKNQWLENAAEFGISLEGDITPQKLAFARNFEKDGYVVTYSFIATGDNAKLLGRLVSSNRTLIICDEIHHVADGADWGKALVTAIDNAVFRLLLSGTPFRSDNLQIPYVTYRDGVNVSDYAYSYKSAIVDGVCRRVHCSSYVGTTTWEDEDGTHQHTFTDFLSEKERRYRYNTAIIAESDIISKMITDADAKLNELRKIHYRAGGLIIARDIKHATEIQRKVQQITGECPSLISSDDEDALQKIKQFRQGNQKWVVAIKMIAEGVDIPRLRAIVYASNIKTSMFIRQVIGRIVRFDFDKQTTNGIPLDSMHQQHSYFYFPKDPDLYEEILKIEEEVRLATTVKGETPLTETTEVQSAENKGFFIPLYATNAEDGGHVYASEEFTSAEFQMACTLKAQIPAFQNVAEGELIKLIRSGIVQLPSISVPQTPSTDGGRQLKVNAKTPDQIKKEHKFQTKKVVDNMFRIVKSHGVDDKTFYPRINSVLNKMVGIQSVVTATEVQLKKRHDHALELLRQINQNPAFFHTM